MQVMHPAFLQPPDIIRRSRGVKALRQDRNERKIVADSPGKQLYEYPFATPLRSLRGKALRRGGAWQTVPRLPGRNQTSSSSALPALRDGVI